MPDYRRARVPGATYFFTINTNWRAPIFAADPARRLLGNIIRECISQRPFSLTAIVLLPDHLHAIFSLPSGDTEYSARIGWIKKEFTSRWLSSGANETVISEGRRREGRRGVWQPRFWEHTIRDEEDFDRHFDYIHWNPAKHGYAKAPRDWPWSSFHRWVAAGVYEEMWGAGESLKFDEISGSVGE
jgi:putative transposase